MLESDFIIVHMFWAGLILFLLAVDVHTMVSFDHGSEKVSIL